MKKQLIKEASNINRVSRGYSNGVNERNDTFNAREAKFQKRGIDQQNFGEKLKETMIGTNQRKHLREREN